MDLEGDLYSEEHYRIVFFWFTGRWVYNWGGGGYSGSLRYLVSIYGFNWQSPVAIYLHGRGGREGMTNENNRYRYACYFDDDYPAWQAQKLEKAKQHGAFTFSALLPSHYTPATKVSETIILISRQLVGRFRIKEVSLYKLEVKLSHGSSIVICLKGFKASVKGVLGAYTWLAIFTRRMNVREVRNKSFKWFKIKFGHLELCFS